MTKLQSTLNLNEWINRDIPWDFKDKDWANGMIGLKATSQKANDALSEAFLFSYRFQKIEKARQSLKAKEDKLIKSASKPRKSKTKLVKILSDRTM